MNDTNPEVAALLRQKLLERSGAERIMMASGMFEAAKAMVLASFPAGLTEIEVKRRLVERIYGDGFAGEANRVVAVTHDPAEHLCSQHGKVWHKRKVKPVLGQDEHMRDYICQE